jgi:hypothetical protein
MLNMEEDISQHQREETNVGRGRTGRRMNRKNHQIQKK